MHEEHSDRKDLLSSGLRVTKWFYYLFCLVLNHQRFLPVQSFYLVRLNLFQLNQPILLIFLLNTKSKDLPYMNNSNFNIISECINYVKLWVLVLGIPIAKFLHSKSKTHKVLVEERHSILDYKDAQLLIVP